MSDLEQQNIANKPRNRRAVVKGAAWSVPVIAAAIAAPAASASVGNATVSVTGNQLSLLQLGLLDGSSVLTAGVLVNFPTVLSIANGAGALVGDATGSIVIRNASGIAVGLLGHPRGIGVLEIQGATVTGRSQAQPGGIGGSTRAPITTTNFSATGLNIPANGAANLPITFGLTDSTGLLSVDLLTGWTITVTMTIGSTTLSGSGSISIPVGAGLL